MLVSTFRKKFTRIFNMLVCLDIYSGSEKSKILRIPGVEMYVTDMT